eukprot:1571479-Prymnesium_polylepis.1
MAPGRALAPWLQARAEPSLTGDVRVLGCACECCGKPRSSFNKVKLSRVTANTPVVPSPAPHLLQSPPGT